MAYMRSIQRGNLKSFGWLVIVVQLLSLLVLSSLVHVSEQLAASFDSWQASPLQLCQQESQHNSALIESTGSLGLNPNRIDVGARGLTTLGECCSSQDD